MKIHLKLYLTTDENAVIANREVTFKIQDTYEGNTPNDIIITFKKPSG